MSGNRASFRAAAVQLSPVLLDRDGTTDKVVEAIEACGREGVRLAVFPETIIPSYPYFAMVRPPAAIGELIGRLHDQAVEVPGPVTEKVGAAAGRAGSVVVLGVNERDGGSLYNTQLIFDADGSLVGKRRKIMPTFHERMIWGWGDGSGLRVFETAVGRIGALICWEHYMPLARYALMAAGEQIHCSHFPGSLGGEPMAAQIDAAVRHHAMESGAFVVNATCWLSDEQRAEIAPDEGLAEMLRGWPLHRGRLSRWRLPGRPAPAGRGDGPGRDRSLRDRPAEEPARHGRPLLASGHPETAAGQRAPTGGGADDARLEPPCARRRPRGRRAGRRRITPISRGVAPMSGDRTPV